MLPMPASKHIHIAMYITYILALTAVPGSQIEMREEILAYPSLASKQCISNPKKQVVG